MRIIDEAGLDAVKQTPGYRESEFQLLREVHVNPDDEAGSRIAFCAALRESPDIRGTVNALLAYAEWYRTWVANHAGMKTRTIAQFIDAGLWRKFRVRKENA